MIVFLLKTKKELDFEYRIYVGNDIDSLYFDIDENFNWVPEKEKFLIDFGKSPVYSDIEDARKTAISIVRKKKLTTQICEIEDFAYLDFEVFCHGTSPKKKG